MVYSEVLNRYAGLDAAGVLAYRAFDHGAQVGDIKMPGHDHGQGSATHRVLEAVHALGQGIFPTEDIAPAWPVFDRSWCGDPPTANIELDGIPISLHYPSGPVRRLCREYFRNCPATSEPARCYISAQPEKNGWKIRVNGREFLTLDREQQIGLGLIHAARSFLYHQGNFDIAFHAAVVAYNHCAIMLSAQRERGKSTLAAYLVAQGFELLTDEPALLNIDSWSVRSLHLPICLKEGSWPALRQQWPQLSDGPVHLRSDETKMCLAHPTDGHCSPGPCRLTQIVFPHYRDLSMPHVESVSPLDTLGLLTEAGMLLAKHFTRDHFEAFLTSLCRTPAYKLEYGSLQDACRMIREIDCSVPVSSQFLKAFSPGSV